MDDAVALANGARGSSVVVIAGDGVVGDGVVGDGVVGDGVVGDGVAVPAGYEVTTPPGAATPSQVVTPAAAQPAVGMGVLLHSRVALRTLARARMIVSDAPLPAYIVPRRGQLVAHVSGRHTR